MGGLLTTEAVEDEIVIHGTKHIIKDEKNKKVETYKHGNLSMADIYNQNQNMYDINNNNNINFIEASHIIETNMKQSNIKPYNQKQIFKI